MTDPDMGTWSYEYDDNGNLVSQTDAKGQVITFVYDDLNRLTNKNYELGSGMTDIVYSYDDTSGGNYGVGKRTGMTDAAGTQSYIYDNRGRLLEETRTISATPYTTSYTYDGADRVVTITYPTGETVTNGYNDRGLPYSVSGSVTGDLVTGSYYNQLGQITEIDLGNSLKTTFGYYGLGGTYDTTGGYYGKLWEIATLPQAGGDAIQQVGYTWDACGNMATRGNALTLDMETFTYDSLDRLTGVSGAYTQTYTYDTIGNITSMNGVSYTYGDQPHAVTSVGNADYIYDDNGNMTDRDGQGITWDVENRPTTIDSETYVYDGNGNRIIKIVNGVTILYISCYYAININTDIETSSYYLGDRLVAQKEGETLRYIHQDYISSSSVMSDEIGQAISAITYFPFGATRTGSIDTDEQFTGQKHDDTGLYYYGARYYDPTIGRFISADAVVQISPLESDDLIDSLTIFFTMPTSKTLTDKDNKKPINYINSQELNRYSYVLNNPLKYVDPLGSSVESEDDSDSSHTYTIIWGYIDQVTLGFLTYTHSVIVVVDEDGNYFMIETWGGVINWPGVGISAEIFKPGVTFEADDINDFGTWNFGGFIGMDLFDVFLGISGNGNYLLDQETDRMGLSSPGFGFSITRSSVKQIDEESVFDNMPRWVENRYESLYDLY